MADPEVRISGGLADESGDVEMQAGDGADVMEVGETGADDAPGDEVAEDETAVGANKPATRITFVDYLKSPIVTLHIGSGDAAAQLTAHQALLVKSPFFADAIAPNSTSPVSSSPTSLSVLVLTNHSPCKKHSIDLRDDDLEATSCFLEYLYTGEYFPHKLPSGNLQVDSSAPAVDQTGDQLLKHAKVYTLAEKLSMPTLKTLSHSKIHLVTSTAVAELTYARYVYSHTKREDATIRKPVASFWGQRSHVLRHETEGTFRKMCLEYPEFAFDVLSFVLDAEEKREERRRKADDGDAGKGSARKRPRGEK